MALVDAVTPLAEGSASTGQGYRSPLNGGGRCSGPILKTPRRWGRVNRLQLIVQVDAVSVPAGLADGTVYLVYCAPLGSYRRGIAPNGVQFLHTHSGGYTYYCSDPPQANLASVTTIPASPVYA